MSLFAGVVIGAIVAIVVVYLVALVFVSIMFRKF